MLTLQSSIARAQAVLATELDGELIIMGAGSGAYYCVDAIGADIWKRIEKPVTVGELCSELAVSYEGDLDRIRHDVLELLARMTEMGLVRAQS